MVKTSRCGSSTCLCGARTVCRRRERNRSQDSWSPPGAQGAYLPCPSYSWQDGQVVGYESFCFSFHLLGWQQQSLALVGGMFLSWEQGWNRRESPESSLCNGFSLGICTLEGPRRLFWLLSREEEEERKGEEP